MKKMFQLNGLVALALIVCSGCASIVDGGRKKVQINSNPPGAMVTVTDSAGRMVASTNTPVTVRLPRYKDYFQGEKYTVKFDLPGYYPSEMQIRPALNPWYFGNIMFGGVIGLAVVDPMTGAMWTLSPRKVDWNLISKDQNLTPEQLKTAEDTANPMHKSSGGNSSGGSPKGKS
jgi:hypothetical protein